MWSKARRVLQSFVTFFTFHLLKNSSLAVSSARCLNLNSVKLTDQERGEKATQEWKFQHVPVYRWKGVVILSLGHDLCHPLTLPVWTEVPTSHPSQQHLCMTPSYPAEGFSLNSSCFHLLLFICGTRLPCIRLAFISSQSCLSREEMWLRCTEEEICPKVFVRKCLCLEQKRLNQGGEPGVLSDYGFCGVPHQAS